VDGLAADGGGVSRTELAELTTARKMGPWSLIEFALSLLVLRFHLGEFCDHGLREGRNMLISHGYLLCIHPVPRSYGPPIACGRRSSIPIMARRSRSRRARRFSCRITARG
jgi:hypothetical protein